MRVKTISCLRLKIRRKPSLSRESISPSSMLKINSRLSSSSRRWGRRNRAQGAPIDPRRSRAVGASGGPKDRSRDRRVPLRSSPQPVRLLLEARPAKYSPAFPSSRGSPSRSISLRKVPQRKGPLGFIPAIVAEYGDLNASPPPSEQRGEARPCGARQAGTSGSSIGMNVKSGVNARLPVRLTKP